MLKLDSPFMRFIHILTNSVFITLLMVVCSLPVVTCGAALCAGYDTMRRYLVKGEGENALFVFFRAFKRNFKQSTVIWLICGGIGFLLWQGYRIMDAMDFDGLFAKILPVALIIFILICLTVLLCALANVARFHNTVFHLLHNSMLLCISNFWRMILLMATYALAALLVRIFPPLILVMPAACVYCWYLCMEKVFAPYLKEEPQDKNEDPS